MNAATHLSALEHKIEPHQKLISVTDQNTVITYCNEDFAKAAGYTQDELIGKPHSIVSHPDMPKAIAESMIAHLKAGKCWMGIVKNRNKEGGYYWTDAYVTPIFQNGALCGFESVRVRPTDEQVQRAEALYARLRDNKKVASWQAKLGRAVRFAWLPTVIAGTTLIASSLDSTWLLPCTLAVLPFVQAGFARRGMRQIFRQILRGTEGTFDDKLIARTYTDLNGIAAKLTLVLASERARTRTVLSRLQDYATRTAVMSAESGKLSEKADIAVRQQQQDSDMAAVAMHEMATAISQVSSHVCQTADEARQVNQLAQTGLHEASETRKVIERLMATMQDIGTSVTDVAHQSATIQQAANMISDISKQTNLLALNAAIEAARAGEQGRGFAVVSDEVRALASRTRESTEIIQKIIGELQTVAERSVEVVRQGGSQAQISVQQVINTQNALMGIGGAVGRIDQMAQQMAATSDEQARVAEDISGQLSRIAETAQGNAELTTRTSKLGRDLDGTADALHALVARFNH